MRKLPNLLIIYFLTICNIPSMLYSNKLYMGVDEKFTTLRSAFSAMSNGDTLIIKDGVYQGIENIIDINHFPPDGTPMNYTVLKAEHNGRVIFDGQNANVMFKLNGSSSSSQRKYIQFDGILWCNSNGSLVDFIYANHIKMFRCGVYNAAENGDGFTVMYCSAILLENCYSFGESRKNFYIGKNSDKIIVRQCVVRHDCGTATNGSQDAYIAYDADNVEFQNCIVIDSDKGQYYVGQQGEYAFTTRNTGSDVTGIFFKGCISIANKDLVGMCGSNNCDTKYINCIHWDSHEGSRLRGSGYGFDHCTMGQIDGTSTWSAGCYLEYGDPITNSIVCNVINYYGIWNAGVNDYNCLFGNKTNYIGTTPGANNICSENKNEINIFNGTGGNGITALKYICRIENGSDLNGAASDGSDIGATILNKIGVSGTLWGEPGYNELTNEYLWPFSSEGIIREHMRAYFYDNGNLTGNRGFCADRMTLTDYIWGYLGNTPPDLYPPIRYGSIPEDDAIGISVDSDIILHIQDERDGVDISSIIMTVEGVTVYSGLSPSSYPYTRISGSTTDYTIIYNSPLNFTYNQKIDVTISAYDLASPPNVMPIEYYSFTTQSDTASPYTLDHSPSKGSSNIDVATNVKLHVKDDDTGVDLSSLIIKVEGVTIYNGSMPGLYPNTIVSGNANDYIITYNPPDNFDYGQKVDVAIVAKDFAAVPNMMPLETYYFTTTFDTTPPYMAGINPAQGANEVPLDASVIIHIKDEETGVDDSSIIVTAENIKVYDGTNPENYPHVSIIGNKADYILTYNSVADFQYGQQIDISVTARDLAITPNIMDVTNYYFKAQRDINVPYISSHDPENGETEIAISTDIGFRIHDDETGVDISSLIMTVENETVYNGNMPEQYPNTQITGNRLSYFINYSPPTSFSYGQQVDVTITAHDLSSPPNNMPEHSYFFFTRNDGTKPYTSMNIPPRGTINVPRETEISFHLKDDVPPGIDLSSVVIGVAGDTVYWGEAPDKYNHIYIVGNELDYFIKYTPPNPFKYDQIVNVRIEAQDLAEVPSIMPLESYFFTTVQDTIPPHTSGYQPAPGATDISVDTSIAFHIQDNESGVDISSIMVKVNRNIVFIGKSQDIYSEVIISGDSSNYMLSYHPNQNFQNGRQIEVIIAAQDLARPSNQMPVEQYFFTTIQETAAPHQVIKNPERCVLYQNYPNPFNPGTLISFNIKSPSRVIIIIYCISGQIVKKMVFSYLEAGTHQVFWDGYDDNGSRVSSGLYICKIIADSFQDSRKMLKLN